MSDQKLKDKIKELEAQQKEWLKSQSEFEKEKKQLMVERQNLAKESQRKDPCGKRRSPIVIGSITEFSLNDDWDLWSERLHHYFVAIDVSDEKKVSLFLTLIAAEGYALLRNLCMPTASSTRTLEELLKVIADHLQPKPSIIFERYKFKECKQKDGENVKKFIANLKRLSLNCEFGRQSTRSAGLGNFK
ncbi:uncharacterized protein LOC127283881 [Leptopilina boulardi]|uniref:uncharacterized protein LOC127283881 n=1 Tax=Leptopilina boulardi TaxID=63433 RepID=UPI0021F59D70|nr:uncharacterized protein LOC127283881 [Leptopilina boulardi]